MEDQNGCQIFVLSYFEHDGVINLSRPPTQSSPYPPRGYHTGDIIKALSQGVNHGYLPSQAHSSAYIGIVMLSIRTTADSWASAAAPSRYLCKLNVGRSETAELA
jgi:hypothetical protein